ncbi:NAD-dependent epimerase/dehydratase family protein [Aeromicrobium phragmitis]|uniref:NAD-dependent epimerase/dehydratase family protein n=1 Tax=Aeromicrobium phragmitis TaxID=2478914 RepID=A0A3L8PJJ4_9ACTN|nr:NAD-dependent epimerase/dehydratase family protein [Aeromicrobium phragmitis]RLV55390.1 NAD-dependent epimerase/dehydratase family protein [Aeromicrobium phragmitis]
MTSRVLILGGTAWLGRHLAAAALERGAAVTCLARGESGSPPDGVEWVRGDRSRPDAYDELDGEWDHVIDVARVPSHVASAVATLRGRAAQWTFISTGSVYADQSVPLHEDSPLLPAGDDDAEYGSAKVACEQFVGPDALVVRAGLIVGPGDPSDRGGYYVARMSAAREEPVVVPAVRDQPMQMVDVRDLAGWVVELADRGVTGVVHGAGERTTVGHLLDVSAQVAEHAGDRVEFSPDELTARGANPWAGERSLPWWLPTSHHGMGRMDDARALQLGLERRPIAATLTDVLADEQQRGVDRPRRAGLSRTDELELLHSRGGQA